MDYVDTKSTKEVVNLDPGIRTFMTGLSENEVIKLGVDVSNKIKKHLTIVDNIKKKSLPKKIIKKYESCHNKKISYLVDELHWKTINYLVMNYKNILIGDMSVKGITSNVSSNITKMTKRIAYRLKFYKFYERLQYKCNLTKTNYRQVNESYTSKVCSSCGYIKSDLGSSKIFNCNSCKMSIERDINGCRGIFIKNYM
jgi:putative transposase